MNASSHRAFVRPLAALLALFVATLHGAPLDAERLTRDTFTIRDGGRGRSFVIARDEVGVIAPDGRGRVQKVAATADAEAVRQRARQEVGKADLVLYEQGQPRSDAHRRWLTARVLAKVRAGGDAQAIATAVGAASFERPAYAPGVVLFTAPAGAGNGLTLADALSRRAEVESAEPLLARTRAKRFTPNDPFFANDPSQAGYQWHLRNTGARGGTPGIDVNVTTAWDTVKGAGVRIAIVDDGLELTHPDLAAHVDTANDFDYNGNDADPSPEFGDDHGTACAGVAAAIGNNALGVSGAAPEATLVGLRLISGPVTDADEAAAFTRRSDIIQIKSNSWGPFDFGDVVEGPGQLASAAIQDAIANGRAGKGTLFFWAAGNGGPDDNANLDGYANSIFTLAIAALGDHGVQSDYSEDGANILVTAPSDTTGRQGVSTVDRTGAEGYNDGTAPNYTSADFTNDFGGTSSACPLAAGVGALLVQANPNLTWRDVKEILLRTATKNDSAEAGWDANPVLAGVQDNGAGFHFNHKYGAGLLNAAAAVTLAQTWTLLPPMSSMAKSNTTAVPIPDDSGAGVTRSFTFAAGEALRVESVTVAVDITHPNRSELEIELTSPSGTVSRLLPQRPNDFNSDLQWTLSSVHHWGESAVGTWTVVVKDRAAGDEGTLNAVTLTLYGSGALITGAPVITSAGTAGGPQGNPFSYQITATQSPTSFGATGLPAGLTVSSLTGLISGTPSAQGVSSATISATNALGTGTLPLTITIGASLGSLVAEAVDQPALPFVTALPNPWFHQTTETHDGSDAARSAAMGDGQSSSFSVEITGPIVVSFWWRVSSQAADAFGNGDYLRFSLDGFPEFEISGEIAWQQRSIFVPAGPHTLDWSYDKDFATTAGLDAGFVDQLVLLPFELSPPIISVQPVPLTVAGGSYALFAVEAASATPLSYQWLHNNVVVPGATGRTYLFTAAAGNVGSYSCRVTNVNGTTDSAAALLTVNTASGTLANALDSATLFWTTSGDLPIWARTTLVAQTHDGVDAARAAGLAVGEFTTLETTVLGPGTVSYWWRCDGEADYDYLEFLVDEDYYDYITSPDAYTFSTWYIPPGLHTLRWTYYEDQEDEVNVVGRGLVDQVVFTPTPFATWQAANFTLQQRGDEQISGPDADPNGDGVNNLAAYAFGIHPLTGAGAPQPRAILTGAERAMVYQKNTAATDVSFFVDNTADITDDFSWLEVTTTDSILSTNGALQTIKAVVPATANPLDYYRLRLELAE